MYETNGGGEGIDTHCVSNCPVRADVCREAAPVHADARRAHLRDRTQPRTDKHETGEEETVMK